MNGELDEEKEGGGPRVGSGVTVAINLTTNTSSYLREMTELGSYSSSPRIRRLEDMKRSYLTNSPYSSTSTFASKYCGGSGTRSANSYRLASLDRLAYRQKLYESNAADGVASSPSNGPAAESQNVTTVHVNGSASTNRSNLTAAAETFSSPPKATSAGATPPFSSAALLQTKREMFFKSDSVSSTGSGGGGSNVPVTHPSTAPPAPPVATSNNHTPPTPPATTSVSVTVNSTPVVATTAPSNLPPTTAVVTTNAVPHPHMTVASIKEQLLTSKEKKDEESKEIKIAKETVKERRPREPDGYVGFANLPNQVYRKAVKRGFEFSLMVVGESGLGKSTLINSMFLADVYSSEYQGPSHRVKKTVQVETTKTLLKENGVNLMLTVVDTPGFGDAVDNSDCWQPVINYIENKYEEYLNAESRVNRIHISDSRVHCCLYFIAPSGHGLKPLDVEFMKRLHDKVNIIPVVAKADTLTPDECIHLKKQILNEVGRHKIKIYEFPEDDTDGTTLKMKQRVPFAVVGSNTTLEMDGKKVRGRKYPWGVVEVENMEHCDFIPLRNMMIRTHMQDLKDVTNNVHYENYRCKKLAGIGGSEAKIKMSNKNPLAQMEEEKKDHGNRMKKMEAEMEQVFEMKVKEKMSKLHELENDLQKRNESMRKKLEADLAEMEEERERFEKERKAWEAANNVTVEELRRNSLESSSKERVDGKFGKKKKGLF